MNTLCKSASNLNLEEENQKFFCFYSLCFLHWECTLNEIEEGATIHFVNAHGK